MPQTNSKLLDSFLKHQKIIYAREAKLETKPILISVVLDQYSSYFGGGSSRAIGCTYMSWDDDDNSQFIKEGYRLNNIKLQLVGAEHQ